MTINEFVAAVHDIAGRGIVQEIGFSTIRVCVPFYRIRKVRNELRGKLPITIALDVRALSFLGHVSIWSVYNR